MPTVTGVYYLRPISTITSDMDNCPFSDIDDNIFKGLNAHSATADTNEYCLNAGENSAFTSGVYTVGDIPANSGAVVSGVTLWSYSSGISNGTTSIFKAGGGGVDHLVSGSVKLDNQWYHDAYGPAMATSGGHDGAWAAYKFPEYEGSGLRDSAVSNMAINLVSPPQLTDDEFRIYAAYLEVTWTQEVPFNHCSCHCPDRVSALLPNFDGSTSHSALGGSCGGGSDSNFVIIGGPSNRYAAINNGVLTPDDSDYIRREVDQGCNPHTVTAFFGFEDMPADFDVLTSGSLRIRDRLAEDLNSDGVKYQFFHMDEVTPLTNEIIHSGQNPPGDTDIFSSFTNRLINFNLTGKTDKTSWDNALLKVTHFEPAGSNGEDREYQISEMELVVGYDRQPILNPFPLSSGACCSFISKFDDDLVSPCADSLPVHPLVTKTSMENGLKIANSLPVSSINDHIATNGLGNRVAFSQHITNSTSDWPDGTYLKVFEEKFLFPPYIRTKMSGDGNTIIFTTTSYPPFNREPGEQYNVYLATWNGSAWILDHTFGSYTPYFGASLDISDDGNKVVIGSPGGYATSDSTGMVRGRVFTYEKSNDVWSLIAQIDSPTFLTGPPDTTNEQHDEFGWGVAISSDGTTITVGSPAYRHTDASFMCGRINTYSFTGVEIGSALIGEDVYGTNSTHFQMGRSLAIDADGDTIIPGFGRYCDSNDAIGEIKVFRYSGGSWSQLGNTISLSESGVQCIGYSVSISDNGNTVAISAKGHTGYGESGWVEVYDLSGSTWVLRGSRISGIQSLDPFEFSGDGNVLVFGDIYAPNTYKVYAWDGASWVARPNVSYPEGLIPYDYFFPALGIDTDGSSISLPFRFGSDSDDQSNTSNGIYNYDWNGSSWVLRGSSVSVNDGESFWDILGTPINSGSYLTETLTDHLEIVSVDMNTSGNMFAVCWKDNQCIDCNVCEQPSIPLSDDYHIGVYYWSDADSNWKRRGNYISSPMSAYIYANGNAELVRNPGSFGDQIRITSSGDRVFIKNSPADPNSQQSVEAYDWDGTEWNHYNTIEVGRLDYDGRYVDGIFDVPLFEYPVPPSGDETPAPVPVSAYNYTLPFSSVITGNPDPANDYTPIQSNFPSDVSIDSNDDHIIIGHGGAYVHTSNDGVIKLLKTFGSSYATIATFYGELIYKDSNNSDFFGATENSNFGSSVDISSHGKFIVGGAPSYNSNRGYVKVHYQKSVSNLSQIWSHLGQEIIGNYSYSAGEFGFDVAIATGKPSDTSFVSYNPVVVIGAPYVDQAGTDAGMIAIYRYKDKTTSTDTWELVQEIQGPMANGRFGYSVAIDNKGETIAVGMPHTTEKGRVYIYKYNSNTDQYEIKKSVLSDYPYESSFIEGETKADLFGFSVDINGNDGNYVIAGAPNYGGGIVAQSNRGYVKSYRYKDNKWVTVQSILDPTRSDIFIGGHQNTRLGYATSISDDGNRITFSALNASTGKSFVQVFDLIQPDASLPKWYYPVNIAGANSPIISDGTSSYGSNLSLGSDKIIISSNELGVDVLSLIRTNSNAIILANPHLHGPYEDVFNSSVDTKLSTTSKKKSKTAYCLALRKQSSSSSGTKYSFFVLGQKWFLDPDLSIKYPDGVYKCIGPAEGVSEFQDGWAEISNGEVIKGGTLVSYDYPAANK